MWILPIAYNTIVKVSSDLYICAKDCKYGVYCVKRRKFVIQLQYDNISVSDNCEVIEAWVDERKVSFDKYGEVLNMPLSCTKLRNGLK